MIKALKLWWFRLRNRPFNSPEEKEIYTRYKHLFAPNPDMKLIDFGSLSPEPPDMHVSQDVINALGLEPVDDMSSSTIRLDESYISPDKLKKPLRRKYVKSTKKAKNVSSL